MPPLAGCLGDVHAKICHRLLSGWAEDVILRSLEQPFLGEHAVEELVVRGPRSRSDEQ